MTATRTSKEVDLNRHRVDRFYHSIREKIYKECLKESPFSGEIESDESYFGGKRRKGRRGRGTGKTPVFGLLKRGGSVYTQIVPNAKKISLRLILTSKITPGSRVYTDKLMDINLTGLTINEMSLSKEKHILTGLKALGVLPKIDWLSIMA